MENQNNNLEPERNEQKNFQNQMEELYGIPTQTQIPQNKANGDTALQEEEEKISSEQTSTPTYQAKKIQKRSKKLKKSLLTILLGIMTSIAILQPTQIKELLTATIVDEETEIEMEIEKTTTLIKETSDISQEKQESKTTEEAESLEQGVDESMSVDESKDETEDETEGDAGTEDEGEEEAKVEIEEGREAEGKDTVENKAADEEDEDTTKKTAEESSEFRTQSSVGGEEELLENTEEDMEDKIEDGEEIDEEEEEKPVAPDVQPSFEEVKSVQEIVAERREKIIEQRAIEEEIKQEIKEQRKNEVKEKILAEIVQEEEEFLQNYTKLSCEELEGQQKVFKNGIEVRGALEVTKNIEEELQTTKCKRKQYYDRDPFSTTQELCKPVRIIANNLTEEQKIKHQNNIELEGGSDGIKFTNQSDCEMHYQKIEEEGQYLNAKQKVDLEETKRRIIEKYNSDKNQCLLEQTIICIEQTNMRLNRNNASLLNRCTSKQVTNCSKIDEYILKTLSSKSFKALQQRGNEYLKWKIEKQKSMN